MIYLRNFSFPDEEVENDFFMREKRTCFVSSDDVFDYILNVRNLNEGIDRKREDLFSEYFEARHS